MSKYRAIPSTWHVDSEHEVYADGGSTYRITTEVADVQEAGGHVWHDGAWRVSVEVVARASGDTRIKHRAKSKIGESAWSWAARYASDLETALRFGKSLPIS